jgi:hypothetical protein
VEGLVSVGFSFRFAMVPHSLTWRTGLMGLTISCREHDLRIENLASVYWPGLQPLPTTLFAHLGWPKHYAGANEERKVVLSPGYVNYPESSFLDWILPCVATYFLGGAGLGIFNVHEPPNTIVRPCTRALAEYSS